MGRCAADGGAVLSAAAKGNGAPLHVARRGVNRCAIFVDDLDRNHVHDLLREAMAEQLPDAHAYVFVGNHGHRLPAPPGRRPPSTCRHTLAGAVQVLPGRHRPLPDDRPPLHRARSRARPWWRCPSGTAGQACTCVPAGGKTS
ncbi:hypothetical protein UUC_11239 [Rhodanobacter denitrificans]|nr:hypothetical protein UUC_11239 [Rhodanobacter denitrificans]